jgi:hypothetical protein
LLRRQANTERLSRGSTLGRRGGGAWCAGCGQVRARDRALLAEDLRRVYGARNRGEVLEALEEVNVAWRAQYPGGVGL